MKKHITTIFTLFCAIGIIANAEIVPQDVFPTDFTIHKVETEVPNINLYEEQANFLLNEDLDVDITADGEYQSDGPIDTTLTRGVVPGGTHVNCYLLHAEPIGSPSTLQNFTGEYTFDEPILGVIVTDEYLELSDLILGRVGTAYPIRDGFSVAGYSGLDFFEDYTRGPQDKITVLGKTVTLDSWASNKMDEVRVITQAAISVGIDIKPGSFPNSFNIDGNGVIPMAILGSEDLDVTQIDPDTLKLGGLEVAIRGKNKLMVSYEDVNGDYTLSDEGAPDGYLDLVVKFVDDPEMWAEGTAKGTLTGNLLAEFGGTPITGFDSINVVKDVTQE